MLRIVLAIACVALCWAAPASADSRVISSVTSTELVDILQTQGFSAEATKDQFGDPLIVAQAGQVKFTVWTYNCSGTPSSCDQLQFMAEFALPGEPSVQDIVAMNEFNRKKRFGRGVIQPNGSATVDYTVNLRSGVSVDNLADNMAVWVTVLADFMKTLGWNSVGA